MPGSASMHTHREWADYDHRNVEETDDLGEREGHSRTEGTNPEGCEVDRPD